MANKNPKEKTSKKKSRLGRGLGALLGDVKTTTQIRPQDASESVSFSFVEENSHSTEPVSEKLSRVGTRFREIPVEQLQRGKYQPRIKMDKEALRELSESIKSQGVLQPLLVRPLGKDQFEIIAGERRWRGAQLAGLQTVPAVVRAIEDQTAMAVGLIENIQRENLNAIEEARGYRRLLDEFGLTHQEVSEAVGCSRTAVSNLLRLLSLHKNVQKMLEDELIDMGHARALLALPENYQPEAAKKVISKKLSVRQTEQLVKSISQPKVSKNSKKSENSADVRHLEESLSKKLGAKVNIEHGSRKGRLVIHYHSLDELDGILERIK